MIPEPLDPARNLAFPDHDCLPPRLSEGKASALVASNVAVDLLSPKLYVGFWSSAFPAIMAVPKTAMHEYHRLESRQDYVRLPGKVAAVESKSKAGSMKRASHGHFRLRVLRTDPRHQSRARLRGERVDHYFALVSREGTRHG